jgi:NifU-like protein involved in Fe-S cluster formation
MDAPLYNAEILRLAASIPALQRLPHPAASATRSSPVCGSRVRVELEVDADGRVSAFAQEVRACALGQASAAILGQAVMGQTAPALRAAHAALAAWLRGPGAFPDCLADGFPLLRLFEPARAHPARHPSICLAFDAAAAAAEEASRPDPRA